MSDPTIVITIKNVGPSSLEFTPEVPVSIMFALNVKTVDGTTLVPTQYHPGSRRPESLETIGPGHSLTITDWVRHDQVKTKYLALHIFGYRLPDGVYLVSARANGPAEQPESNTCRISVRTESPE